MFTWSANGAPVSEWWLYAGSTAGGRQHCSSGNLGDALTETVTGLPINGSTVWIRLWYRNGIEPWSHIDEQYTASTFTFELESSSGTGVLTTPIDTFNWSDINGSVTAWWLYVGSARGANDYEDSNNLNADTSFTTLNNNLPTGSVPVHVRLWYQEGVGTGWKFVDRQFTSAP